jgi:hypothetical protein
VEKLEAVAAYNLIYNAAVLVERGVGYALGIEGIANVAPSGGLCFRLLEPRVESGLSIAWKKRRVFSPAAGIFLERLEERWRPLVRPSAKKPPAESL